MAHAYYQGNIFYFFNTLALNSVLSGIDIATFIFFLLAFEYIFQSFYFQPFSVTLFYICIIVLKIFIIFLSL